MSVRTVGLLAGLTTGIGVAHRLVAVASRRGPVGPCSDCRRVLPVQYLEAIPRDSRSAVQVCDACAWKRGL